MREKLTIFYQEPAKKVVKAVVKTDKTEKKKQEVAVSSSGRNS